MNINMMNEIMLKLIFNVEALQFITTNICDLRGNSINFKNFNINME